MLVMTLRWLREDKKKNNMGGRTLGKPVDSIISKSQVTFQRVVSAN